MRRGPLKPAGEGFSEQVPDQTRMDGEGPLPAVEAAPTITVQAQRCPSSPPSRGRITSLQLRAGGLDHRRPFRNFGFDIGARIRPARCRPSTPSVGELLPHVGILHRLDHGAMQRLDDVFRRAGRRDQAMPRRRLKTREAPSSSMVGMSGRIAVRLSVVTASARTCSVLDKAHDARGGGEHHLVLPGNDVLQGRRRAFIGHMHDVDMRHGLEQFAGEMRRSP